MDIEEMQEEENFEHEVLDRLKCLDLSDFDYNAVDGSYVDAVLKARDIILTAYEKEKEKNKNKDKILRNIREEFLKYDWKDANPIQTYNQIKSLYESIYCKPYED